MFTKTKLALYCKDLIDLQGQEDKLFRLILDDNDVKDLIIMLNTSKQFGEDHVDSLGNALFNRLYKRTTYSQNDPLGRAGKPYELRETGEFWDSFKVSVRQGDIVINADPFKDDDNLFEIFGENIVGLTDESLNELIALALEKFINWYDRKLLPS